MVNHDQAQAKVITDGLDITDGQCNINQNLWLISDGLDITDGQCDYKQNLWLISGGLDITDGRYDPPEFHLWSTLSTRHSNCNDFYNNCTPGTTPESGIGMHLQCKSYSIIRAKTARSEERFFEHG